MVKVTKVTVPGEFTAMVYSTVALVCSGEDHYKTLPSPKGKPVVTWLRTMRARGLWAAISADEYRKLLDSHAHAA